MPQKIEYPELIIGIVGAVGTDLKSATKLIKDELNILGYSSEEIRISKILSEFEHFKHLKNLSKNEAERIAAFMKAGDDLRKKVKRPEAMATLAVGAIRQIRKVLSGAEERPVTKHAYILNSLKRPEEISLLKRIYGDLFLQFSIYTPREKRKEALAKKICRTVGGTNHLDYTDQAEELINKDDKSGHKDYGQNVQDAFATADFYIKDLGDNGTRDQIQRVLNTFFGHPFITPSQDEFGLYFANAAARRSADLSRQVGAAILSEHGDIISVGCNDVPKYGGGIPWEGDKGDFRDFIIGKDQNVSTKDDLVKELLGKLKDVGWLNEEMSEKEALDLAKEALYSSDAPLKGTRVASLIEFGRIVHAEMNALMDATRQGTKVANATLYCTTFPCHMCARHIIAAGIKRVVFVEPYPKSMAEALYSDLAAIDELNSTEQKVSFESFVGISPNKYDKLFAKGTRKTKDGYAIDWDTMRKTPTVDIFRESYVDSETVVTGSLESIQETLGQT
ncbi:MAG: anti-phage dCTP deaminase [Desulfuromonadales bacterium]|nr:anti-phage dCTP deaminase [Desulfuromonadales bacterium]